MPRVDSHLFSDRVGAIMKLRTSKLIFLLWLSSCHLLITPIVASYFWNNEAEVPARILGELETLKSYARKISIEREHLELFYKEWLSVTADTLEFLNGTRDAIIEATKTDNYITLAASAAVGVIGGVSIMLGGVPLLLATIPSFGLSAIGVQVLSGTRRYLVSKFTCNVALSSVKTSKRYTKRLDEKMHSYFEAMSRFKEFFSKETRGGSSKMLFAHMLAQSEGFFEDLSIDKKTEEELRSLLKQIGEIDDSSTRPHILILESVKSFIEGAQSLVVHVISELNEIRKFYINDDWGESDKGFDVPRLDDYNKFSAGAMFGASQDTSSLSLIELIEKLIETENAVSVLLTSVILTGEVVVGAVTAKNLAEGSKSVESEAILKTIEELADLRSKVVERIKANFGW